MTTKPIDDRLDFNDPYEQNRTAFIARLVKAGWTKKQAEQKWEEIQNEDESGY